ncbi:hypothetical protein GDO78_013942 [Eleutherodactylus coqui]|uniref:Secreted protein n=1 Tax=Eleutherodactylus coqui TaxID=57060 RepID=A0A8J6JQP0_ELECQ|nr:hypothetical protein GDO78_013942 [Eleutherodactylus coqui]
MPPKGTRHPPDFILAILLIMPLSHPSYHSSHSAYYASFSPSDIILAILLNTVQSHSLIVSQQFSLYLLYLTTSSHTDHSHYPFPRK